MIPDIYQDVKIYPIGKTDIPPIITDRRFRKTMIVLQPLNIVGATDSEIEGDPRAYLLETNAVDSANVVGTVTFKATPPLGFEAYEFSNNAIDLNNPHFISLDIAVKAFSAEFSAISGATHISIGITSYID